MRALTLGLMLLAGGCCDAPWKTHAMGTQPDRQCRTGGEAGYDVYIWECTNSEKVVISAYSASASCASPVVQTAACGKTTPIEDQLGSAVAQGCEPPPASMRWP